MIGKYMIGMQAYKIRKMDYIRAVELKEEIRESINKQGIESSISCGLVETYLNQLEKVGKLEGKLKKLEGKLREKWA